MSSIPHDGWAAFQKRRGLKPDGKPGKVTLAEVESMEADAITQQMPGDNGQRLTERDCQRMAGVHPELQAVAHYAIRICPHPFIVTRTGGKRSAEMQRELFAKGASKKDGTRKLSRHQSGEALDVVSVVDGKVSWSAKHATTVHNAFDVAANALGVTLRWGGDWDGDGDTTDQAFFDLVHHERPRGAKRAASPMALAWMADNGIEVA